MIKELENHEYPGPLVVRISPPTNAEMKDKINELVRILNFILDKHPKIKDEIEQYEYDRIFNV